MLKDMEKNEDIEIFLFGDKNVGKTQIISQLIEKKFKDDYHNYDIENFDINYTSTKNHVIINLDENGIIKSKNLTIYENPRKYSFNSINNSFLRTANIIILVYDVTNIDSFMELYDFNKFILENIENKYLKCIIANKKDLTERRKISEEEGKKFADKIEALYCETCALNKKNISDIFNEIISIYSKNYEKEVCKSIRLLNKQKKKKKKFSCCGSGTGNFADLENREILYHLKILNEQKKEEKNEIIEENINDYKKEIIKYVNGNYIEILDENKENKFFEFNNGDTFKINRNKDYAFITGKFQYKDIVIDTYDGKIVNLLKSLFFINNQELLTQENKKLEYINLDNNFAIKIKYVYENIVFDDNLLKDKNMFLFLYDKFEEDFINKFKLFYNKFIEMNKDKKIIGIIIYKNKSKNKNQEIIDLTKSLNIFYEEIIEDIDTELFIKDILNNKYLKNFENKILENEEGTYLGDVDNNKKEGYGIMLYKNGAIYIGNWKDDIQKGDGLLFYDNTSLKGKFEDTELKSGEISSMEFMSFGNFLLKDDSHTEEYFSFQKLLKYEGTFRAYKNDYGKLKIKNGNIYEGNFEDKTYKNGNGTIFYPNGDIYKGEWKNFRKNGKGVIYTKNGEIFESEWEDDHPIGNGILKTEKEIILISQIQDEEKEKNKDKDIENIKINFKKEIKKYNFNEKLGIIEDTLSKINSNLKTMEEYDNDIGKIEYNIKDIYHFWEVGKLLTKDISHYVNKARKILFFQEFYENLFKVNEKFKEEILNKVDELMLNFLYLKKYIIFKCKITIICDEILNTEILEKNCLAFNEIDFFEGIVDNKGLDINKILSKNKGIIIYENGDIYKGEIKDCKKHGKGSMIYENDKISKGNWENDKISKGNWENDNYNEFNLLKYKDNKFFNDFENNEIEEMNKIELDNYNLNDKDINNFINNVDITKQFCQIHKHLIIGLCIDENCKEKSKLLCQKCLFKEHKKHEIVEIEEYNDYLKKNIIKEKNIISEFKDMNKNKNILDNIFVKKISELKQHINSLIDQKVESYISSIFESLTEENENKLKQKIIKLQKNYPIDNIDKQIEIQNLIFEKNKINFDSKIEAFNDIFDIKFIHIKKDVEEIISGFFEQKYDKLYEIENYWTKEILDYYNNFNYELSEKNTLAKKLNGNSHFIKSKLELKEGNYIFFFNITYENNENDFLIGFGNIENKEGFLLSNEGLFINEIKINENVKIENNDEICFILILKEKEKFFILIKNGKYIGKYYFNSTKINALASIEGVDDSVKLKTFIKL